MQEQPGRAACGGEQAQDGPGEGMQQLASDLVCLQGSTVALELLQSIPELMPDLLKVPGEA